MKNQELFNKTVSILVNAYKNDTLEHEICNACAVGNIVAANCGITNIRDPREWINKTRALPQMGWGMVFYTPLQGEQVVDTSEYKGVAKFQIDSTGYTWQELAKVEYAFETAPQGDNDDDWMLNGLLAVYDVLCEIHEVNKEEVQEGNLIFVR